MVLNPEQIAESIFSKMMNHQTLYMLLQQLIMMMRIIFWLLWQQLIKAKGLECGEKQCILITLRIFGQLFALQEIWRD